MENEHRRAFTTKCGCISRALVNRVSIRFGDNQTDGDALWDTGANGTCISHGVVDRLGLIPIGKENIKTPSGNSEVNTYIADIILPNHVLIPNVKLCETEIGDQGIDFLIGMDIITQGDFSLTNANGRTVFSFCVPASKVIDYVAEISVQNKIQKGYRPKKKKR